MIEALKEITKRSAYFRKIEEDVEKYAKQITELKPPLVHSIQDMIELLIFHKQV